MKRYRKNPVGQSTKKLLFSLSQNSFKWIMEFGKFSSLSALDSLKQKKMGKHRTQVRSHKLSVLCCKQKLKDVYFRKPFSSFYICAVLCTLSLDLPWFTPPLLPDRDIRNGNTRCGPDYEVDFTPLFSSWPSFSNPMLMWEYMSSLPYHLFFTTFPPTRINP